MISVIIPVYRTKITLLERCLKSIAGQSYRDIEVIIVNDGSGQAELEKYLDDFSAADSRFHVISQENSGVSAARNRAIESATGEYIFFVDADDSLEADAFSDAVKAAEKYNADIVLGGINMIFPDKTDRCGIKSDKPIVYDKKNMHRIQNFILALYHDRENGELDGLRCRGPWSKLIRRSAIGDMRFRRDIPVYEDILFNVEVMGKMKSAVIVPGIWYNYYIYDDSSVRKYRPDGFNEQLHVMSAIHEIVDKYPELRESSAMLSADSVRKIITGTIYNSQSEIKDKKAELKKFLNVDSVRSLLKNINISSYPDLNLKRKLFYVICKSGNAFVLDLFYK
jgi:glycosyltransferase involved in cell wall biosynthesis